MKDLQKAIPQEQPIVTKTYEVFDHNKEPKSPNFKIQVALKGSPKFTDRVASKTIEQSSL